MLERLVGRLLNNFLSKYFVYQSTSNNSKESSFSSSTGTPLQPSLGVWSGYIALDNLQLKTDVINDLLQERGIPLEVLHCTIRRVEITVPWSKLRTPGDGVGDGAAVVIVMDGIHVLARTLYEYNDEKIRQQDVQERRRKLNEAQNFDFKKENVPPRPSSSWYSVAGLKDFIKQRMSKGLLQKIADKLHVHIRDMHIRLEDAETDPTHPFACGIVMESMHVQQSDDVGFGANNKPTEQTNNNGVSAEDEYSEYFPSGDGDGDEINQTSKASLGVDAKETMKEIVRIVAQVNHYAIYWNALGYEKGLPLEHSIMHRLPSLHSPQLRAAALDRGIARRANALWSSSSPSPGGKSRLVAPAHNYLLLPMDCSLHASLSVDPDGRTKRPFIDAIFQIDNINVQLRDFQCHQLLLLVRTIKEHNFTKPYRKFRPQVAVHENPSAWWRYAFRVISHQLKGSRLRWSWGRMRQKYAGRNRYCELYERQQRHIFYNWNNRNTEDTRDDTSSLTALVETSFDTTPDDGAGPALVSDANSMASLTSHHHQRQQQQSELEDREARPLSEAESRELHDLEDGVTGDMSVEDIILYRLLVNNHLGHDFLAKQQQEQAEQTLVQSWIFGSSMVQNAIQDDIECRLEVQRLIAYLEHSSAMETSNEEEGEGRQNDRFLSIQYLWRKGCLAVYSPLPSMANEPSLLRRLHERFLDFSFSHLSFGYTLMGDFDTMKFSVFLRDYSITEIRASDAKKKHPILSRRPVCNSTTTEQDSPPQFERKKSFHEGDFASMGNMILTNENPVKPQNQQQSSFQLSPLLSIQVGLNPPHPNGCRVTVKAKVEAVEVVLHPDGEWIRRLKIFLQHGTAADDRNLEDYWKLLNYASINAWASKSMGLRAKAETAMDGYKSINFDVSLHLPIIQIFGKDNKNVWIDLGSAQLNTVKLAGVASQDLKMQNDEENIENVAEIGCGVASVVRDLSDSFAGHKESENLIGSVRSVASGIENYLEGQTMAVSFDNNTANSPSRRSRTGRNKDFLGGFGKSWRPMGLMEDERNAVSTYVAKQEEDIHSCFFYDVYQLQVTTGKAGIGERCESSMSKGQAPLLAAFKIQVNIHKSIIPADHTISRFRIDCILTDIVSTVSPTTILHFSTILQTWKSVMKESHRLRQHSSFQKPNRHITDQHAGLAVSNWDPSIDEDKALVALHDSVSNVDEDEFFDAIENDENSENISMWIEDDWIADADSVLDSNTSSYRHRRHRTAMSDVSSLSERSVKKRHTPKKSSAYLSEENLAMLEEGMIEEESLGDNDDNDSDSFHSAISPSRFVELINELDKTIQNYRARLSELNDKLSELSQPRKNISRSISSDSTKQRRILNMSLKLEQERLRAELNEMVATRYDLATRLAAMEEIRDDPGTDASYTTGVDASVHVRRANLLLTGKKDKKPPGATSMQHNLTSNLNPQLVKFSIVLSKVSIKIHDLGSTGDNGASSLYEATLCLSQTEFALHRTRNDTKVYLSAEHANASCRKQQDSKSQLSYVFLAGSQYSLASSLLPSHFPQYISSASMEEKFLKCTLEMRHQPLTKSSLKSPQVVRLRAAFGDVEATPEPKILEACITSITRMRQDLGPSENDMISVIPKQPKKRRALPEFLDVAVQLASVRVVLNQNGKAVAAVTMSETWSRFAHSSANAVYKCRNQIDIRCNNIQILHIEDLNLGKGSEVLGRRDAFHPLLKIKIRSQLVPPDELGGWAAGSKLSSMADYDNGTEREGVWNVHAGGRIHFLGVTVASHAIDPIRRAIDDLIRVKSLAEQILSDTNAYNDREVPGTAKDDLGHTKLSNVTTGENTEESEEGDWVRPIRWRADIAIKKTTISFLGREGVGCDPRNGTRNSLITTWSLLASFEETQYKTHATRFRLALADVSVVRSKDELSLLEPLDLLLKGKLNLKVQNIRPSQPNLKLPSESPWNEVAALFHKHSWDYSHNESRPPAATSLEVLVTPAKSNLSAQLCAFTLEVVSSLKESLGSRGNKTKELEKRLESKLPVGGSGDLYILVALRSVDIILLRESGSKPNDAFASFRVEEMEACVHKCDNSYYIKATVVDAFIFDLSCPPGVNALARRYYRRESENVTGLNREILSAEISFSSLQEATVAKIYLHFGNMRCLVLPSLLQGIILFKSKVSSLLPIGGNSIEKNGRKISDIAPPKRIDFVFSFKVDGFDCVFPSRDISSYVREHTIDAISVVSLRWKSNGSAVFVLSGLDTSASMMKKMESNEGESHDEEASKAFISLVEHRASKVNTLHSRIFASNMLLSVDGLQVLRTSILPLTRAEKDPNPYFFKVYPPTAGEQLITNSFDFNLAYKAFGVRLCVLVPPDVSIAAETRPVVDYDFAHTLHLEGQLIDVLLYIAQSPGGINDSLRVSVTPLVEILKQRDSRDVNSTSNHFSGAEHSPFSPRKTTSFGGSIKQAPLVCSIRAAGIRVTCVPGGATRLTESPIVKFSLTNLKMGLALCLVPVESKLLTGSAMDDIVESMSVVASLQQQHHLMAGAWLNCELSASYHNRRLVAWEPFIEPWTLEVQCGADLVKLLKVSPISYSLESGMQKGQTALSAYTGEKLRDIRKLLQAPFRKSQEEAADNAGRQFSVESDFAYLLLVLSSRSPVNTALYPTASSPEVSVVNLKGDLETYLPSKKPLEWLACFGYPPAASDDDASVKLKPSFACAVSDVRPLNINLTGALIENVFGYLKQQEKSRTVAPHWIKNDSGLTIRFQEVLEEERLHRGEKPSHFILSSGTEVPLSLRRTLSQSSDPHRAYIRIELGSFEDTVGRIDRSKLATPAGKLSKMFFYKIVAKVPVDTVGVHRYPLDRNVDQRSSLRTITEEDSRSLGWLIVRVALQGGIKVVSIESPLAVKNDTDSDLLLEIRAHDRLSLLWRSLILKPDNRKPAAVKSYVPVDIVPFVNDRSCEVTVAALSRSACFDHESQFGANDDKYSLRIRAPRPYSQTSLTRGLIDEVDVTFPAFNPRGPARISEQVHVNACSLRIGMFDASPLERDSSDLIPEQRMLLFRPPLVIRNYLAYPICVQVRAKAVSSVSMLGAMSGDESRKDEALWEILGVLECGEAARWTGAVSSDDVEMRVKFISKKPEKSRRFNSWSSVTKIPAMNGERRKQAHNERFTSTRRLKMRITDTSSLPLDLSVAVCGGFSRSVDVKHDNMKEFSDALPPASRVASIFVPFWIVDSTGLDLEFSARGLLAGQVDSRADFGSNMDLTGNDPRPSIGLAELLEDARLHHLPSKSSFSVHLLGDDRSRKLSIRQRISREQAGKGSCAASWSKPIYLRSSDNRYRDVTAPSPPKAFKNSLTAHHPNEPYALRSRIVSAPQKFGGKLGTKIVHVVCRYAIVNELGREIEIVTDHSQSIPILIRADGKPKPFHFDDSGPIQFRPREFGWVWSGRFYVRSDRREVAIRIRHKLKRETIIVNIEVHAKGASGTCMIILRAASHPPFRFENNTMYPLSFRQSNLATNENDIVYNREVASSESFLLPYHHEDFAWDEPEHAGKSVLFEVADFGERVNQSVLGRFNIDRLAPGTDLKMESSLFIGQVIADGPTRVLRISETCMPRLLGNGLSNEANFRSMGAETYVTVSVSIRLKHGLGVSVVDWSPQELLFLRLEEINLTKTVDQGKQVMDASIGRISIDNQLWISPYPVLLEMGSRKLASTLAHIARRKSRRRQAMSLSVCQPLISAGLYGDLTLLERLELVTDPINIFIDGSLAISMRRMLKQAKQLSSDGDEGHQSRNSLLCKVLSIPENSDTKHGAVMGTTELYSAGDAVATAVIAAKARSDYSYLKQNARAAAVENERQPSLSKTRRKCYVEKLRISTTKLEISWSGSLPILSAQSSLPLSLTFEGFPLLLRPYSSSHAYGTVEDHVQSLKGHYLSIWRVVDLLVGLASKPTFMIHAVFYTWSESVATTLGALAQRASSSKENLLLKLREARPQPVYEDRLLSIDRSAVVSFHWKISGLCIRLAASCLQSFERTMSSVAALFRYNPTKYGGVSRRKTGLVRTRNPRLFANVDGKDLLVEYTEGENAGKALLSRIRMGIHLGEGYIYHIEGLYQRREAGVWANSHKIPVNLILMMTFERMVLVKGELSVDFCAVYWEVTFENLIYMEANESEDPGFHVVTIWYLANSLVESRHKGEELLMARYAKSLVGDADGGIDNLRFAQIYVPRGHSAKLIAKARETKKVDRR